MTAGCEGVGYFQRRKRLVSQPGIAKPQFGDNLSKTVGEIRTAIAVQFGCR